MKKFLQENGIILLLVLIVILVLILAQAKKNKKIKEGEIKEIIRRISENVGVDGTDIKTLTDSVTPDLNFDAKTYAEKIHDANNFFNDDEDAVYQAFANKSAAQVAAIKVAFANKYGKDLDEFLKSFLNEEEYNNVINIIRNNR
jgi:hypothetical protein